MTEFLSTEHLSTQMRSRSVRGGAVVLAAEGVIFGLKLGSTAVLARILSPADFGLIAMVTAVTGFVAVFQDGGLSMATVQRDQVTQQQVSTLFWLNVVLGLALTLVLAGLSPGVAWLYREPRLTWVTCVLGTTFACSGLAIQHQALLRRQMRFATLATIQIASQATGIATAIVAATWGAGYWALVWMLLATSVVNVTLLWVFCRWRPGRPCRGSGIRPMLVFGGFLSLARFLAFARRNADNVLLGIVWGANSLGVYTKAYQLLLLPLSQINNPINGVAVPALSRLQHDPPRYVRYYRQFIEIIASLAMPLVIFTFVCAEDVVLLVLGEQWRAAIPVFRALAPGAFMGTLNVAGGSVYVSLGRTDRQFRATIVSAIAFLVAFVCGLPWGPLGVAYAFSIVFCVSLPLIILYAYRGSPLRLSDLVTAIWRPVLTSMSAGCLTWLFQLYVSWQLSHFAALSLYGMVFAVSYVAAWSVLPDGFSFVRRTLLLPIRDLRENV